LGGYTQRRAKRVPTVSRIVSGFCVFACFGFAIHADEGEGGWGLSDAGSTGGSCYQGLGGRSNSHGARPVHLIITMITWTRTSRLSITNSLSLWGGAGLDKRRLVRHSSLVLCRTMTQHHTQDPWHATHRSQDVCKGARFPIEGEQCVVSS